MTEEAETVTVMHGVVDIAKAVEANAEALATAAATMLRLMEHISATSAPVDRLH